MRLTAVFTSLLISAVMLADSQAQAFSVASPTAMFSALLKTWKPQLQSQGLREGWVQQGMPESSINLPNPEPHTGV